MDHFSPVYSYTNQTICPSLKRRDKVITRWQTDTVTLYYSPLLVSVRWLCGNLKHTNRLLVSDIGSCIFLGPQRRSIMSLSKHSDVPAKSIRTGYPIRFKPSAKQGHRRDKQNRRCNNLYSVWSLIRRFCI